MANHVRSIFLIRHGRTSYNAAHKLQGQVDIPLDAVGEWQVKQTAAALKSLYVDRRPEINHRFIVCSDLKRAHATAQAFADVLGGIEPVDDHRVRERSFGDWDGHVWRLLRTGPRVPETTRTCSCSRTAHGSRRHCRPCWAFPRSIRPSPRWSHCAMRTGCAWCRWTIPMALCAGVCWTTITVRPSPTPTNGNANADHVPDSPANPIGTVHSEPFKQ